MGARGVRSSSKKSLLKCLETTQTQTTTKTQPQKTTGASDPLRAVCPTAVRGEAPTLPPFAPHCKQPPPPFHFAQQKTTIAPSPALPPRLFCGLLRNSDWTGCVLKGPYIWDNTGKRYFDFSAGAVCTNLGNKVPQVSLPSPPHPPTRSTPRSLSPTLEPTQLTQHHNLV